MTVLRIIRPRAAAAVAAAVLGAVGCDGGGPKTYPVTATVELPGGDVSPLAGSTVEAAAEGEPNTRIAGEIQPNGQVKFETLHAGKIVKGAPAGRYKARIILADDDKKARQRAAQSVAARHLKFETAGFDFQVPPPDAVVFQATRPDPRQAGRRPVGGVD